MSQGKIERSLYYYDLELQEFDEQEKKFFPVKEYETTVLEVFEEIKNLPIQETEIKTPEGNKLYMLVDGIDKVNKIIYYRLVLVKVDAFPLVEWEGNLQSLNEFLDKNQNIAEITHAVLFYEYGVIGSEFNFSGARATAVSKIIRAFFKERDRIISCKSRNKLDKTVYEKIIDGESLSLLDLSVKSNSKAHAKLKRSKSFLRSMIMPIPSDLDTFEIVLKKKKSAKNGEDGFECISKEEIIDLISNNRDDLKKFKICQEESITKDSVDLLSNKLIEKKTFAKTANRQISSNEMYKSIEIFFNSTVINQSEKISKNE